MIDLTNMHHVPATSKYDLPADERNASDIIHRKKLN